MSQSDFGNLESPLTGTNLINTYLEPFRDALHTFHSGTTRPSYAQAGMVWADTNTTNWSYRVFDGTDDVSIAEVDTTNNYVNYKVVADIQAGRAGGVVIKNQAGTVVATMGASTGTGVTLAGALTVTGTATFNGAISATAATPVLADSLVFTDLSDSSKAKTATISDILALSSSVFSSSDITGQTEVVITAADYIVFSDTDDTGNLKKDTVGGIVDVTASELAGKADTVITATDKITFYDASDSNLPKTDTVDGIVDVVASQLNAKTDTVITATDKITFYDASDSNLPKTDTVQGIIDLATLSTAAGAIGTYSVGTASSGVYGGTISGAFVTMTETDGTNPSGTIGSGTWRLMSNGGNAGGPGLYLRIS